MIPELGAAVYVRYRDHVLFKDADPGTYRPFVREAIGWLDYEDGDCVKIVWERFAEPVTDGEAKQRASGLVIMKNSILELRRVS